MFSFGVECILNFVPPRSLTMGCLVRIPSQVWGTSDVLSARLGLTPWACKKAQEADPRLPIVFNAPKDLLRAGWDTEAGDWGAFAAEELSRRDVIGT